jgi:indolepyruvate ferredoxin oxidoreductase
MILDMSGLAQKGGAVLSHVRLSQNTEEVTCSRIVTGTADVLLAADEVVAVAKRRSPFATRNAPLASSTPT